MDISVESVSALNAPNQYAEVGGRRLAWRAIGEGKPIVLCTRFRGTMDVWEASRAAAQRSSQRIAQRTEGRSPPVPVEFAVSYLGDKPLIPPFPADQVLELLKKTDIPILHIGGDHDIIFPVENWYALNGQLPTLQLHTFPRAGHGPQHEHPDAAAQCIGTFLRCTSRS